MSTTLYRLPNNDVVEADDSLPPGRVRAQMVRDARRWQRQGLTFEGVELSRRALQGRDAWIVWGKGYTFRTLVRDGAFPVDQLEGASLLDWEEV